MSKNPQQCNSSDPPTRSETVSESDGGTGDARAAAQRAAWMSALALADGETLERVWVEAGFAPTFDRLRGPEVGLVMTRGRAGGGAAFNLGEATATRCSVRLDGGAEGHAYVLGRTPRKAEIAALCDALLQTDAAEQVQTRILAPLAAARAAAVAEARAEAEGTRVEFFTMTRGEGS